MDLGIEDNAALITASSRGLGLASAKALAREGVDVTVCGTTEEHLANAKSELEEIGSGDVIARQADVTDPDEIERLVEVTVEAFGSLDHVVTSAGGVPSGPFLERTEHDWYTAFDVLVMSHVWTLQHAYPQLVESDAGSVVAIASTSVVEVIEGLVLSNAVRRAVVGNVKTIAREWAPEVRANVVLPGPHETGRIQDLIDQGIERGDHDDYEDGLASWAAPVPMNRIGDPMELGDAVAFLASERASFITGASLPVDGGQLRS